MQPMQPNQPIAPLPAGPPKRGVPGIVIALGLSVVFCVVVAVGGALFVGAVVLPFLRDPLGALLPPGDAQAKDLAVSADGRWLAVSYGPSIFPEPKVKDYSVQVIDLGRIQTAPLVFRGHNTTAYSVAISPEGEWVAAEGDHDTARVWNTRDPAAPPILLPGLAQGNTGLGFSPTGTLLASSNNGVQLWDLAQPARPLATLDPTESADAWVFSADGQSLVISQGSALRRWDLRQPTAPPTALPAQDHWWNTLAFAGTDLLAARFTIDSTTDDRWLEIAQSVRPCRPRRSFRCPNKRSGRRSAPFRVTTIWRLVLMVSCWPPVQRWADRISTVVNRAPRRGRWTTSPLCWPSAPTARRWWRVVARMCGYGICASRGRSLNQSPGPRMWATPDAGAGAVGKWMC